MRGGRGQPGLPELPVLRVLIAARGLGAMARVKKGLAGGALDLEGAAG